MLSRVYLSSMQNVCVNHVRYRRLKLHIYAVLIPIIATDSCGCSRLCRAMKIAQFSDFSHADVAQSIRRCKSISEDFDGGMRRMLGRDEGILGKQAGEGDRGPTTRIPQSGEVVESSRWKRLENNAFVGLGVQRPIESGKRSTKGKIGSVAECPFTRPDTLSVAACR